MTQSNKAIWIIVSSTITIFWHLLSTILFITSLVIVFNTQDWVRATFCMVFGMVADKSAKYWEVYKEKLIGEEE